MSSAEVMLHLYHKI